MSWFREGQQWHLLSIIDELQLIHAKVINSGQTKQAKQRNDAFNDEQVNTNRSLFNCENSRNGLRQSFLPFLGNCCLLTCRRGHTYLYDILRERFQSRKFRAKFSGVKIQQRDNNYDMLLKYMSTYLGHLIIDLTYCKSVKHM